MSCRDRLETLDILEESEYEAIEDWISAQGEDTSVEEIHENDNKEVETECWCEKRIVLNPCSPYQRCGNRQKSSNTENENSPDDCLEEFSDGETNVEEVVEACVTKVEKSMDDISECSTISFSRPASSAPEIVFIKYFVAKEKEVVIDIPEDKDNDNEDDTKDIGGSGLARGRSCCSVLFVTFIFAMLLLLCWIFIG